MKKTPQDEITAAVEVLEKTKLPEDIKARLARLVTGTREGVESIVLHLDGQNPIVLNEMYYTSGQAAKLMRIPKRTARRYLTIGKIEGEQHPITGTWNISRENLIKFLEKYGYKIIENTEEK